MSSPTVSVTEPTSEPAPSRAPLVELLPVGRRRLLVAVLAVGLAVASFADFGASGWALLGAVLCPTLVLLAAIDIEHRLLPNGIVLFGSLAVALILAATEPGLFVAHLAAGAALGGFFFAFAALIPGSIGMGDAKLGFLLGLALGSKTLSAMMAALLGLLVAALVVLARRGVAARKETLPFGPFLAAGAILGFFLG